MRRQRKRLIDICKQYIIKAFEGVEPLPENATDQQINRLYNQILFVATHDYEPIDTIDRFPYMVFKKDHINPYTKQQIQENQQVNLEIVLDASGSMAAEIGGRPMMDIAKQSIKEVVQSMPANSRVGLRVFGHQGDNTDAKQAESCAANELVYPIEKVNVAGIEAAMQPIQPTGWTIIASSIENGINDLQQFNNTNDLNMLYIVTDGIETCGGNAKEVAKRLTDGKTNVVLGIIGFNVDAQQDALLRDIAKAGNGYYARANDAARLTEELQRIKETADITYKWKTFTQSDWTRIRSNHISGNMYNGFLKGLRIESTRFRKIKS